MNRRVPVAWLAALVAGCAAVGEPDYRRPEVDLPAAWKAPVSGEAMTLEVDWWRVFEDAALSKLIEEALSGNLDIALAAARVQEARAALGLAEAERAPSVGAQVSRDRTLSSGATGLLPPSAQRERNNYRPALNFSYEVDLWGRLRVATEAARADLLASEAARDTVRISLQAQVAQSYFALRALDAQIEATRRTLAIRRDWLGLQRKRLDAGLISDFEVRQLEADEALARAQLPALERAREREEAALAVLLGRSPRGIVEGEVERPQAPVDARLMPALVPAGLPSDLLLRRPDIAQAEHALVAANARIAVARTSFFPSLSLTGFLGSESAALGNLFTGPAGIWQFAVRAAQPIFQGGRLQAGLAQARAREEAALAAYQRAIQAAFREVRDALSAQARSRESFEAEVARERALAQTLRLARLRYEQGLASQLEVLDAERNLLSSRLNRLDAWRNQHGAVAELFKALGGGWNGARPAASAR